MSQSSSSLTKFDLAKFIGDHFLVFRLPAESYATLKETEAPRSLPRALRGHEMRWATEFIEQFNLKTQNEAAAPELTLHALCTGNATGHYVQRVPRAIWNTMGEDVRTQFCGTNDNVQLTQEALMARHATIKLHADKVEWKYKPSNNVLGRRTMHPAMRRFRGLPPEIPPRI